MLAGSARLARLLPSGDRRKPTIAPSDPLRLLPSRLRVEVAREVLRADAANLPPMARPRRCRKEEDVE